MTFFFFFFVQSDLFSNFRTQSIHYKLELILAAPNQEPLSYGVVWTELFYKKSLFTFILNVSRELLNQSSGILPFRAESLLTRMFKPTFLTFVFNISKFDCLEVKIWFTLSKIHSSEWSFVLYSLNSWIDNR